MKVLIRMLASILPGVVVGLGVIGYLERESIQEEWASIFGHHDSEEVYHAEAEQEESPLAIIVEPESEEKKPLPVSELKSIIVKEDIQNSVAVDEPKGSETPVLMAEPESEGLEESSTKSDHSVSQVVAPATEEPALDQVLGLEQQQNTISISEMMDDMPITAEQVVAMKEPMQRLADQFSPLSSDATGSDPYGIEAEKRRSDVWHIESLEEESELQWLWNRGRQAFWEGDYELAVESYRSLLQEEPMNPDGWGELGNIYYAKKDWTRAVRAFGRAAVALTQADRVDEADRVLTVIRGIDPALADQISATLAQQMLKKQ